MVEDTRIGVVLFAEENSDSLKMMCKGISWNVSNTDVALAYTLSPDLAQAFNQSSSEMSAALILQEHTSSYGGMSLNSSRGPRLVVSVGTNGEPLSKELLLSLIQQTQLAAELVCE
jgi:hypothetical protein